MEQESDDKNTPSPNLTPETDQGTSNQFTRAPSPDILMSSQISDDQTLMEVAEELEKRMDKETLFIRTILNDTVESTTTNYATLFHEIVIKETSAIERRIITRLEEKSRSAFDKLQLQVDQLTSKVSEATTMVDQ